MKVQYHEHHVGNLEYREGQSAFQYSPEFLETEIELSPMHMPLSGGVFTFSDRNFESLPPMLADALPDQYGKGVMRAWFLTRGILKPTPVQMLSYVGQRGMGALSFSPTLDGEDFRTFQVHEAYLDSQRLGQAVDLPKLRAAAGTAGGRYPKALFAEDPETGALYFEHQDHPENYHHWIIKFGDPDENNILNLAEVELAYVEMARDCGIDVVQAKGVEDLGKRHFISRRFDFDEAGGRIHMQTLAALTGRPATLESGSHHSYEELMEVAQKLCRHRRAVEEIFRRMVFNVLTGNTDDHAKNHAFLMREPGDWWPSPAYDLTFSRLQEGGTALHSLTVNYKGYAIRRQDLLTAGEDAGLKKQFCQEVIEQTMLVTREIGSYLNRSGCRETVADLISKNVGEIFRP